MDKVKRWFLASCIILLISTASFGILIPYYNSKISEIQSDINNVSEQIYIKEFNIKLHSDQLVKLSSTSGTYVILKELKSSYQKEWENHLRAQYIMAIIMLDGEKTDVNILSNLGFEELEELGKLKVNITKEEYNKLVNEKNRLEEALNIKIRERDNLNVCIIILQLFGLSLGILAGYLKKD